MKDASSRGHAASGRVPPAPRPLALPRRPARGPQNNNITNNDTNSTTTTTTTTDDYDDDDDGKHISIS